ncbi:MAG: lysophospholipid acyltransferase family protein [Phycisphaerales bacterium]
MGKQSFLANISQYLLARGVMGFAHSFSENRNLEIGARLGSIVHDINGGRRKRAIENVRWCLPDVDEARAAEIVEQSYQHMIQLFLVDSIAAPKLITADAWPGYVEMGNVQPVIDLLLRNRPAIMITGHCGNWELLGSLLGVLGYPIWGLARPLDNPLLNDWLVKQREARGMHVLSKFGSMQIIQSVVRTGGYVAFVADQNAGDRGLFTPFFGRLASSYKSIALLAMRYRVPIVAGMAMRLGNYFKYRLHLADIIEPDDWLHQPDPIFYITARYNRAIESMVRMAPEQYLWVHRRWKSRPRHEREGKPFPKRLRAKLEALPWMTDEEMQRILEGEGESALRR